MQFHEFIQQNNVLISTGNDAGIDAIYQLFDTKFISGDFNEINDILPNLNIKELHVDTLITILTTTFWAKNKLSNRSNFVSAVKQELLSRDYEELKYFKNEKSVEIRTSFLAELLMGLE